MIKVEVLATGSKGNCYLLSSGETRILLDCGLPYKKTLKLLDYKLPTAILVTHEHKDHAKAAKDFVNHGVDVFMTDATSDALKIEENHRLHLISGGYNFKVGDCVAYAFNVPHDAVEPINFLINDGLDNILYLTDLGYITKNFSDVTQILIETNFSEPELTNSLIDEKQKRRILENHLSVEKAAEYLKSLDKTQLKKVYLIHISERHGDKKMLHEIIQSVVSDNIQVIVAENKKLEE